MSLSQFSDPVGFVRDCLNACHYQLEEAGVPAPIIAAQRVLVIGAADPLPTSGWLHVFSVPGAVIAEHGIHVENLPEAASRALRIQAMAVFYLSHCGSHPAVASAAFDHLYRALVTRPEMHDAGSKQDRRDRATAAGVEAGKVHSERGLKTDRKIETAWAKLGASGVPERGRSKIIASDLEIDQATVNKRVKALNLRVK